MNIYITLDYELFLNDITGDVDNCLITPTRELLKVLDKHQIKATFFVDMAYVFRLNELRGQYRSLESDYEKVVSQVRELASQGQLIGLHLHPQWFYSQFNGKEWVIDFDHYKLSDMDNNLARQRFIECHQMLCEIINDNVDSFRAGGYSIQGFDGFSDIMKTRRIVKDSTVLYKEKNLTPLHYYDYSRINNSDSYLFDQDIIIPTEHGNIREFPISTTATDYLHYCKIRYKMMTLKNNNNWGNGGDYPGKHTTSFIKKVFSGIGKSMRVCASLDYQSFLHCDRVYLDYKKEQKNDLVMIGHPKNFSPASLSYIDLFVERPKDNNEYKTI